MDRIISTYSFFFPMLGQEPYKEFPFKELGLDISYPEPVMGEEVLEKMLDCCVPDSTFVLSSEVFFPSSFHLDSGFITKRVHYDAELLSRHIDSHFSRLFGGLDWRYTQGLADNFSKDSKHPQVRLLADFLQENSDRMIANLPSSAANASEDAFQVNKWSILYYLSEALVTKNRDLPEPEIGDLAATTYHCLQETKRTIYLTLRTNSPHTISDIRRKTRRMLGNDPSATQLFGKTFIQDFMDELFLYSPHPHFSVRDLFFERLTEAGFITPEDIKKAHDSYKQ